MVIAMPDEMVVESAMLVKRPSWYMKIKFGGMLTAIAIADNMMVTAMRLAVFFCFHTKND